MFKKINFDRKSEHYTKGINSSLPYVIRVSDGVWSRYMSSYTPQKYGPYDTDECYADSPVSSLQAQLNYLKQTGQLSEEAISWYQNNGYLDTDGNFKISYRFYGIISGDTDNGGNPYETCISIDKYGFLPFNDLNYTDALAFNFQTRDDFNADYYRIDAITPAMYNKALKARQYISVQYEWLSDGKMPEIQVVNAAQWQSPLIFGIPIPVPVQLWNQINVPYTGDTIPTHCVCYESINTDGTYTIRDNYNPCNKILANNYYIPQIVNLVITAKQSSAIFQNSAPQIVQPWWVSIWQSVLDWYYNNVK